MTHYQGSDNSWFNQFESANLKEHLSEIKTYAYLAFDQLDRDKNGFIDNTELMSALTSASTNEREKSFISFLINNRQAIADSYDEGSNQDPEGISRKDLDAYFNLITSLL
ncbi:MAG: hypothetical protein K8F91_21345 [Candidatus Obscuribacterales bacterium]|nr:hypothetical protein [Candidatus Obscuribacterales bacterium]